MSARPTAAPDVLGKVALKLARLPEEDVRLVIELVDYLDGQRPSAPLSPAEIAAEAQRRADLLKDVPRDQLVARFVELGEEIRREAIAKGTAIDGDWAGD